MSSEIKTTNILHPSSGSNNLVLGSDGSTSFNGTITAPNDSISGDAINGGTISNFASTGIDDNASSTALTIDSSENVGIGTTSPGGLLHVYSNASGVNNYINISSNTNAQSGIKLLADATRAWELANGSDDVFRILDADISQGVSLSQNATGWAAASDERQKTDWNNFENALNKINSLTKIGTYKSIDPVTKQYINIDSTQVGVSGQEVEKILPEAINKLKRHPDFSDDTLYIQLEYQSLFVLALKAIQELSAKVTALENA